MLQTCKLNKYSVLSIACITQINTMVILESLSEREKNVIEEFQMRVKNSLTPNMRIDHSLYYRFLKARDFDIDKAENMIRKHINYRKINQIETILEDFTPTELFRKYPEPRVLGFDKEGNIVVYSPTGTFRPEFMQCLTMSNFLKNFMWWIEHCIIILNAENEKRGRNAFQAVLIINLDKVTFAAVTSSEAVDVFLTFISLYQDNYPERMKNTFVINAPSYFVILFSILKRIMSSAMLKKIHIFGCDGWKEKLLELVDADVLPAFLGGNRTDPDGNPLCRTFVSHDGRAPRSYFLSDEQRYLKNAAGLTKIVVPPTEKKEIPVEVNDIGTLIQWEFLVKGKDVGFGVFLQESEQKVTEIIPVHKYSTSDGAEKNSYKCRLVGKFIIVFDNSYSWLSTKEVQYRIRLVQPKV